MRPNGMLGNLSKAEADARALANAAHIRAAVAENHGPLLRTIAVLVARSDRRLRWSAAMDVAAEVLHEAVREGLKHAATFDASRSAPAWIRGIAAKLLSARRRAEARDRRCVPAAVLGGDAWAAALDQLRTESDDRVVARRLDLEQALDRIEPDERHVLELRYYQGLDGEQLAGALGGVSPGAARVRLCRALQALRSVFHSTHEVGLP
jgi:RNA polymerase sigma-70 factor, ECF subfamily